ncbi:heterokaryon incompatibility protein [Colletotrichum scovillei]|uniref:heterokaryon incompatibility protein n=1 Tax=Colletotrichum scovillei TaxID=1209932 RepID=UPI0015C3D414|nr:heterokaryon incompatibility protein [Colletotrichum scovillei]KAF4782002.1 heterokaryon incompatibility protein [Colletotrichum scovillei]
MADPGHLSLSEIQDAIHQLDRNEPGARPLLQDPARQIRLFTLWPGTQESPIHGVFSVATLDDGPDYQCISYVWGDASDTKDITVGGKDFKITTSLFSVLRRIRSEQEYLTVWADALCINQDDHEEKRVQVDMMFDIYSKCSNCFFWLGEVDLLDGELSLDIARYGLDFIEFCDDTDLERENNGFSTAEGLMKICLTFRSLAKCQWWRRIWTVQECVAPHTGIFLWGPLTICRFPLIHFYKNSVRAAFEKRRWISDKWDKHYFEAAGAMKSLLELLSTLRNRIESRSQAVVDGVASISFLWNACDRRALDPRDKIFALLPFIAGALVKSKSSNYDIDCVELYSRVTVDLIRSCQSLLPLMGRRQSETPLEGPSWVLDWRRQEMAQHKEVNAFTMALRLTYHFDASHGLPRLDLQNLLSGDGRQLRLRGHFVDTLVGKLMPPTGVSAGYDDPLNYMQSLKILRQIWKQSVAEDAFSALRNLDGPLVTNEVVTEFSGMLDDVLDLRIQYESQDWELKEKAQLVSWLQSRIMTIFLVSAGTHDRYHLVSDCYLPGIMKGELSLAGTSFLRTVTLC